MTDKPIYFVNSFWGPEFREHFLRFSVASLLDPKNLKAISQNKKNTYFICTTENDWAEINRDPSFKLLADHITVKFVELRITVPSFLRAIYAEWLRSKDLTAIDSDEEWKRHKISPNDVLSEENYGQLVEVAIRLGQTLSVHQHYALRILFMTKGHLEGIKESLKEKAIVAFLGADMILSSGAVATINSIVSQQKKALLTATLRFSQENCISVLQSNGYLVPGSPLTLSPRKMVSLLSPYPHPETKAFEFSESYFCDTATSFIWKIPKDEGFILHNLNYYPLFVDMSKTKKFDAQYFDDGGTIDGPFLSTIFDNADDIALIDDSDDLMLATFTPHNEYYYSFSESWLKGLPIIGKRYKIYLLRKTLHGPMGDPIKREFYKFPIKFHSKNISNSWQKEQAEAREVACMALESPNRSPIDQIFRVFELLVKLRTLIKSVFNRSIGQA